MPKLNWQEAKARRQSKQMITSNIKKRVLCHFINPGIEFNLCKGYYCGVPIFDTKYNWCESCRMKFQKRRQNLSTPPPIDRL